MRRLSYKPLLPAAGDEIRFDRGPACVAAYDLTGDGVLNAADIPILIHLMTGW